MLAPWTAGYLSHHSDHFKDHAGITCLCSRVKTTLSQCLLSNGTFWIIMWRENHCVSSGDSWCCKHAHALINFEKEMLRKSLLYFLPALCNCWPPVTDIQNTTFPFSFGEQIAIKNLLWCFSYPGDDKGHHNSFFFFTSPTCVSVHVFVCVCVGGGSEATERVCLLCQCCQSYCQWVAETSVIYSFFFCFQLTLRLKLQLINK